MTNSLNNIRIVIGMLLTLWIPTYLSAAISVTDDRGRHMELSQAAQRIISLAPHITETLFTSGAGQQIVGAVEYSDYPAAAQTLTRVGSYPAPDLERIVALKPDLVIAWYSGNPPRLIEKLRQLGIPVYYTEPRTIADIVRAIRQFGILSGHESQANAAAQRFVDRMDTLHKRYAGATRLSVFYQVWNTPLITVNGEHIISRVIELCGGKNVFADLTNLTPTVSVEAVLAVRPEVIISGGMANAQPEWLDSWKQWRQLPAVTNKQLYFINPDFLHRAGPRIIDGAEQLCGLLQQVRDKK